MKIFGRNMLISLALILQGCGITDYMQKAPDLTSYKTPVDSLLYGRFDHDAARSRLRRFGIDTTSSMMVTDSSGNIYFEPGRGFMKLRCNTEDGVRAELYEVNGMFISNMVLWNAEGEYAFVKIATLSPEWDIKQEYMAIINGRWNMLERIVGSDGKILNKYRD